MTRNPVRKPSARKYGDFTQEQTDRAVAAARKGLFLSVAQTKYKIPMKTISNKVSCVYTNIPGRSHIFNDDDEKEIVKMLEVCAEWRQPFDKLDYAYGCKTISVHYFELIFLILGIMC